MDYYVTRDADENSAPFTLSGRTYTFGALLVQFLAQRWAARILGSCDDAPAGEIPAVRTFRIAQKRRTLFRILSEE